MKQSKKERIENKVLLEIITQAFRKVPAFEHMI